MDAVDAAAEAARAVRDEESAAGTAPAVEVGAEVVAPDGTGGARRRLGD